MPIRLCIFEDHKTLREALRNCFSKQEEFIITGAFSNANNVLQIIAAEQPDVVLMDIQMPGISGIEALSLIKSKSPDVKIVIQTVFEDADKIFAAICAGASGYILKNTTPAKYIEAVMEAYHGGSPITPIVATKILGFVPRPTKSTTQADAELSAREREILQGLVRGESYKVLAANLNITYDTVRFHIKNIYKKLYVGSLTEVVAKAIQNKLV